MAMIRKRCAIEVMRREKDRLAKGDQAQTILPSAMLTADEATICTKLFKSTQQETSGRRDVSIAQQVRGISRKEKHLCSSTRKSPACACPAQLRKPRSSRGSRIVSAEYDGCQFRGKRVAFPAP